MKLIILAIMLFHCMMLLAINIHALGFKGLEGKVGLVVADDPIANTAGLSITMRLGQIVPQFTALETIVNADYWSKSSSSFGVESNWNSITIGVGPRFYVDRRTSIHPYLEPMLIFNIFDEGVKITNPPEIGGVFSTSETNSEIGFRLFGGFDLPINSAIALTAEGGYTSGVFNSLQAMAGFTVWFK